ncbi:MAG: bifunctional phosphopantothenoylcysteine decarboxylase/phosphopantothenate--cysteine ligase CoaBC [Bacteroidales bacterium]|nr:bifunctional phosphopantothenoylcysteine decarboxylase/phosphopantothenate--cysteine ligase CoaBC [Bacteroidales bacterium]
MRIIVGITGGIAAYKAPELVRLLVKAGHEVRCAATPHALEFVTRTTLETVSANPLYCDLFRGNATETEHISLKDWGEMLVIAPATANIIGKMASGIADEPLSTLLLAMPPQRVLMAPAMNSQMWAHPAVQRNLATLRTWGVRTIGPDDGDLACGSSGTGRMAQPEAIARQVASLLQQPHPLQGERWLVTAGPTYERIDSVRFIGNYSSGKMGFALAEALAEAGADVELVAGPSALRTAHPRIHRTDVESARQMYTAATEAFPACRGAILSAAVADYRPETCADHKLKKQGDQGLTLSLVQNPDILATLGTMKQAGQVLVGFALETDNELQNAESKLHRKNLDYIVMNSLRDTSAGFGVDTNKVTLLAADGQRTATPLLSKQEVARIIVETVTRHKE